MGFDDDVLRRVLPGLWVFFIVLQSEKNATSFDPSLSADKNVTDI